MATSCLCNHMERSHRIVLPQNRGVDVDGGGLETYRVSFPRLLKLVACLIDGSPERMKKPGRLREQ